MPILEVEVVKTIKSRANHREVEVLDALRQLGGAARNANLAELLGVSEETIRRTTKSLAKSNLLRRVHGGAFLSDAQNGRGVFSRLGTRRDEKSRIGEVTASLIPEGACVFLDVGSTTSFVAQALALQSGRTIVTNSVNVAQALADHDGNRVFLAGGQMRRDEWGMFGPETIRFLKSFRIDVAVMSVDAIDARHGFLLRGSEEVAVAQAVIAGSDRTIVVADHQKFGAQAPLVICPPEQVETLVTDQPLPADMAQRFSDWDIRALNAGAVSTDEAQQ